MHNHKKLGVKGMFLLSLGALGVVYGDIGTSPLYAINEIFFGHADVAHSSSNIIGVISLVIWSLTMIVVFKYISIVLRADADGEGGVFALFSILKKITNKYTLFVTSLLVLAAGLLYGDGIITPAISVISAIEGLKIITNSLEPYIIPITISILTCLFLIQKNGTHKIGALFGPIITTWFFSIGILGLLQVINHPQILQAINPAFAFRFIGSVSIKQIMLVMGSVMLVITGGEAMYADMGHFGSKPIRLSWFSLVYPALLLNYLGQGAFLLSGQLIKEHNIFFSLVPETLLIPMVILATFAAIIASQALISGAFSLTSQAVALGLLPRINIKHTNHEHEGQIYIPTVNWALYVGCVILILTFRSSSRIAAAYGLAVSADMVINTLSMIAVGMFVWKWKSLKALLVFIPFGLIELAFLSSNSIKLLQGGWIPLALALIIYTVMNIWLWGRRHTAHAVNQIKNFTVQDLLELKKSKTVDLATPSIFLSPATIDTNQTEVPPLFEVFFKRYGIVPKHLVFLHVKVLKKPFAGKKRYEIFKLEDTKANGIVYGLTINFGFMENPNVEDVIDQLSESNVLPHKHWMFHVTNERIKLRSGSNRLRKMVFGIYNMLRKTANHTDHFFGIGDKYDVTVEPLKVTV